MDGIGITSSNNKWKLEVPGGHYGRSTYHQPKSPGAINTAPPPQKKKKKKEKVRTKKGSRKISKRRFLEKDKYSGSDFLQTSTVYYSLHFVGSIC